MAPSPDHPPDPEQLRHGSRSRQTCFYRCGNACDHAAPNRTDHPSFGDVVTSALSRRRLLQLGGAGAAVALIGSGGGRSPAAAGPGRVDGTDLRFVPVPPNVLDTVTVPDSYAWAVVARWGDPVEVGAVPFDPYAQTAASQAKQFGYNCDYVAVLPVDADRALLVVNHEYTDEELMFPGYVAPPTQQQKSIAMMAHGISVVLIERAGATGRWQLTSAPDPRNRRVTVNTPMIITGPAAGHPLLRTTADPTGTQVLGTLNNCAGGTTPWGTTLHGEENFDNCFDASGAVDPDHHVAFARYGLPTAAKIRRGWSTVDDRFDLSLNPNEANRFGWVVELDPGDLAVAPVKRTMLGRFKHEGATTQLAADGRVAVYLGDDERFDYLYKFVSRDPVQTGPGDEARAANRQLLDHGTLFVARFEGDSPPAEIDGSGTLPSDGEFDGSGRWIRLTSDAQSYVSGMSVAEVLINTRLAADLVAPTKMDRPEDVEASPQTGRVYVACTNNTMRRAGGVDEVNPRATNRHGHVAEITEARGDAAARRFRWRLVIVAGDPADPSTYFAGFDKSRVSPMSCPDNLAFDPTGNLWLATNGNALGTHDGVFAMPLAGPQRGYLKQFMTMPTGAEAAGPVITGDARSLFASVQHPGETGGSTFEHPSSDFPDGPGHPPRPSVVVAWHRQDRPIGSP